MTDKTKQTPPPKPMAKAEVTKVKVDVTNEQPATTAPGMVELRRPTFADSFTEENILKFLSGEIGSADLLGFTPDDANTFAHYAYELYQNGRYFDAMRIFANLVTMMPENAYFHAMMGACLQVLDEKDKAITSYTTAIGLDPNNAPAFVNRAEIYLERARFPEALDDLRKAVALDPENLMPSTVRARALAGATAQALSALAEMVKNQKK